MTLQYLIATQSVQLNASGAGSVQVKPDVGQFWYPTIVRVATSEPTGTLIPYCAVYHSNTAASGQPTDFVDDTFTGNNDATGMFSGVCIPYGEAISALWKGGTPGTTGVLRVYGVVSDAAVSTLLATPAARFRNTLTSGIRDLQWTLLSEFRPDYDASEVFDLGFVGRVPAIGVYFESLTNHFNLNFIFYTDPTHLVSVGTGIRLTVRASQIFDQTIPVLGPYATVEIAPSAANSAFTTDIRSAGAHYKAWSATDTGNLLIAVPNASIGAGASRTDTPAFVTPGWATWSVDTSATDWFAEIESINAAGTTRLIDRLEEKAGNSRRTIFLPQCSIQIRTGNNDGVSRTFFITLGSHPFGNSA